jgi:hypothetical protein
MMKPLILIAGATGATGSVATKLLLEKGSPSAPSSTRMMREPKS